jgi:hypothetical protein
MLNHISITPRIEELVDIQDVYIDSSLPVMVKKKSYCDQIKNPHLFRFDDMTVRVSFLSVGPSFQDRIKQYLLSGQSMELTST